MLARTRVCIAVTLLTFIVLGCHTGALAQTTSSSSAKVKQLLQDSGYHFVQKTDTVWYIEFHGKTLKSFKVILASQDDLLVTFVTVATKKQLSNTPEFAKTLLRFNHSLDYVKVGTDDDGDLFVRTDASLRIMDVKNLKEIVEQVSAGSDEVYKGIYPFLTE